MEYALIRRKLTGLDDELYPRLAATEGNFLMLYQPTFARSLPAVALGSLEDEEQEAQEGRP